MREFLKDAVECVVYSICVLVIISALLFAYGGFVENKFYRILQITSDSMCPAFCAGDLAVFRPPPAADELEEGMIVLIHLQGKEPVTHRIKEITEEGHIITKGDACEDADRWFVEGEEQFVTSVSGVYVFKVPILGRIARAANVAKGPLLPKTTGAWLSDSVSSSGDVVASSWVVSPLATPAPDPTPEPAPELEVEFSCTLTADPLEGEAPLDVAFTAVAAASKEYTGTLQYQWDFDDGATASNVLAVEHSYPDAGNYVPTFTIFANLGEGLAEVCRSSVGVAVDAPPVVDYEVEWGCLADGQAWVGIKANHTPWLHGVFTGTKEGEVYSFDLETGGAEVFNITRVLYQPEEWRYSVESLEGTEEASLNLGACVDLGTTTCTPGWYDELGRGGDDRWYVSASGDGARAVKLELSWLNTLIWEGAGEYQTEYGLVSISPNGYWFMELAIPGPADGKGQIKVMDQEGVWYEFDACSFEGEAPLGTWIELWPTSGTQAFRANTQETQRMTMSWLVSGGWGPDQVSFWWVPCVRRKTAEGEEEICGRDLVNVSEQWLRHSGTVVRFYPAKAVNLDSFRYWSWFQKDDFAYEGDKAKVYDVWSAHVGSLTQYAYGRAQVDFEPNAEALAAGDLFYIRWGVDFTVPLYDPVFPAGTRLREHKVSYALVVAADENPESSVVWDQYGWSGELYNPWINVGWVPRDRDKDRSNDLVPEPHYKLDNFNPFGWLGTVVNSVLDKLPTWQVHGTIGD